jgi:hypothetical protein
MADEILGAKQKIGLYLQPKTSNHWDAKAVFSSNFNTLLLNSKTSILNRNVVISDRDPISASSLLMEKTRRDVDVYSQLKTLPFAGDVSYKQLALFLALAVQGVTEAGTTPFGKIYLPPFTGASPFVDFTNNEGYLASIGVQNYGSGTENDSFILSNSIIDTLELTIDLLQTGVAKFMKMNGNFIGTDVDANTQDNAGLTGTFSSKITDGFFNRSANSILSLSLYSPASDAITYTGCFRRATFRIQNNTISDCISLTPENLKVKPVYSAIIDIPYLAGVTTQMKKKFHNGDFFAFEIKTDAITAADEGFFALYVGDHDTTFYNFQLTAEPDYYEGDYVALRLQGDILYDDSNPAEINNPYKIYLTDAIDWAL